MLEDGSVQIYSRNLENTTLKYPDIVSRMKSALAPGVKSIVLDCEAQAWDAERKVFLPFQVLTTRKRKDVKEEDVTVQVCLASHPVIGACVCAKTGVLPILDRWTLDRLSSQRKDVKEENVTVQVCLASPCCWPQCAPGLLLASVRSSFLSLPHPPSLPCRWYSTALTASTSTATS